MNGDIDSPFPPRPADSGAVVSRIESILEQILDCMVETKELSIGWIRRRSGHKEPQQICFPGRTLQEARKFARVILILQLSHDALVSGTILTKRHIYYQHQHLFESQRNVDELVDDLALTLRLKRDDLNIVASSKGLLSGPLSVQLDDGAWIDSSLGDSGTTLPIPRSIVRINFGAIRWIVVVEKDAIFQSLASVRYWQISHHGPGLLVTAKGYPDLMTLSFLQMVQVMRPQMPILALVDFDPDGLNIFRCYRFGPNATVPGENLVRTSIRLLGIRAQHVSQLDGALPAREPALSDPTTADSSSSAASTVVRTSISSTSCRDPISLLSLRDRKQAVRILAKATSISSNDYQAAQLGQQLQLMLMMGIKAETQWLDEAGSIVQWLDHQLGQELSLLEMPSATHIS